MKDLLKQFGSLIGAGIAVACCLGVPLVLSSLGAVGLGFLIHDADLLPLFVGFVALSLWTLYRAARKHARMQPFWLALVGGIVSSIGLWLLVTATYPHSWPVYTGLTLLVSGSVWDVINGQRKVATCETTCNTEPPKVPDAIRRAATGAALSVAAAGAFYAMYKSVEHMAPAAEKGDIACWGVNSCKGRSACSTAFNACTGQNNCKGRGYLNVPARECKAKGGQPLKVLSPIRRAGDAGLKIDWRALAGISMATVSPIGGERVMGSRTMKRGRVALSLAATRQAGRSLPCVRPAVASRDDISTSSRRHTVDW